MTAVAVESRVDQEAIAARRRPLAVVGVFVVEAIVAWVLAAPWAEVFARILGAHPDGDRALFRPGMLLLLDVSERIGPALSGLAASTLIGLAAWGVFGVFVLGALLAALAEPRASIPRAIGRGAEVFFRLFAIGAVHVTVAPILFVLVGWIPSRMIAGSLEASNARTAAFASTVPLVVALVAIAFLTAAVDLARARVVRHDVGVVSAIGSTLRDFRAIAAQVGLSFPRWIASVGLLGFGAAITSVLASTTAIFVVHQSIALLRVGLRASVLARALGLVGARAEREET